MEKINFQEYDIVRVVRLTTPERYNVGGNPSIKRQPNIGDIGTIVHAYPIIPGKEKAYIVECLGEEGTYWVCDFYEHELELVTRAS
jgi:hypothetical protein